ncbi:hypothetical protein [Nocardia sp. CNY236]|uniref:hypothetical protein n=1 Tax=Nocardia sp. CNY236 TaxID=1169152 RepID=UPI0012DC5EA7|nr:hypothetical protein [Nocardia sp. CNY236]
MNSTILGQPTFDDELLSPDIAHIEEMPHPLDQCDEFTSGKWVNMPLFNESGKRNDGIFRDFDAPSSATSLVAEVPYIAEIINRSFSKDHLIMARLRNVLDWSVIPIVISSS